MQSSNVGNVISTADKARAVADLIKQQRMLFGAFSFGVIGLSDYGFKWLEQREREMVPPLSVNVPRIASRPNSAQAIGRMDQGFKVDLRSSLEFVRDNPMLRIDYLHTIIGGIILVVGNALAEHSHFTRSPEIEFFRHIRNGIAHGNRFNLVKYGEPKRTASFNNLVILDTLEGTAVLPKGGVGFVDSGDVLELLLSIEAQLRSIG